MLAPLSETSDGVGTVRPLGPRCRRFWRDPCSVASLLNCFGLGHASGKSPGFPNIPGDGVSASPRGLGFGIPPGNGFTHPPRDWVSVSSISVYARKIWMQTGFFCSYRVHVQFPILAQSTTLRSCRPAAVQPPSSSSLELYARAAAVVGGDYFDRSLRCSTRLYATTSCCFCCFCQVTFRRKL